MILTCPECGCTGDAAGFTADNAYKEALVHAAKLPKAVAAELVPYLGLFRPPQRSLTGPRTLRVLRELAELVAEGTVTSLQGGVPRPCPPAVWALAMRQMAERKGGQRAHLSNHNYLRQVAYAAAEKRSAALEHSRGEAERSHTRPPAREAPAEEEPAGLTEAAREQLGEIGRLIGGIGRKL